jgi:NAD dependent epimerase/dehydratase
MVHYNSQNNWGWLEEVRRNLKATYLEQTALGILCEEASGGGTLEIISGDIQDSSFVDAAVKGCHTVFHLAALIAIPYSYIAPGSYVATNVMGTLNVLESCRKNQVARLVHTSTSEVYGTAQYTPIDERHPVVGQSPYAASKIGADHLAESYYRSFDVPVSIIRPFNTFGPRQSARAVIPTIITQALSGVESVRLGSQEPERDLTYIKDMAEGFLAVSASSETIGQVTNIGKGEGIKIVHLAKLILKLCGSQAHIETDPQRVRPEQSEVFKLVCDSTKANNLLGWQPRCTLRQGLVETIDWIKSNSAHYKAGIYNV